MTTGRLPSVEGGIQPTIVDAKGDLITATAADTPARLAVGANDTVLIADSTTATGLKWGTAAAGGMTLISTTTLTGASITLSSIPQTYNSLYLVIRNTITASDQQPLRFRFNADASANRHGLANSIQSGSFTAFNATSVTTSTDNDNATATSLTIINVPDYTNTTTWKFFQTSTFASSPVDTAEFGYITARLGGYNQTSAISSIELFPNSGNFTSGTVLLYGVK
jgi:hypothetical protein